jgi:hypothetical protein
MVEFTPWRAVQFDFGMNEDRDMFVVDRIKEVSLQECIMILMKLNKVLYAPQLIKYNEFQVNNLSVLFFFFLPTDRHITIQVPPAGEI